NTFTYLGNQLIYVNGTLNYTLIDEYPNDMGWTAIVGDVWFGDFSITYYNSSSGTNIANFTTNNCSSTEIGNILTLSVFGWQGGLIAPSDWNQNKIIMGQEAAGYYGTVLFKEEGELISIQYIDAFQTSVLIYNTTNNVLLFAETSVFGFQLIIELESGDLDGDGLTFNEEEIAGTNSHDEDSDDDGYSDGVEVAAGTDPNYASDFPWTPGIPIHPLPIALFTLLGVFVSIILMKRKLHY
ncbi:MAG: hypothetical protein ACFFCS_11440, partial [Candidatus Hodarchaeota archaeon]